MSLPSFAKACDRTGVSDRSAAILATSVQHDLELVSPIGPIESNRSKQDPPRTLENSRGTPAEWIKLDTSFWSRQQISQKNPCCRTHKHHRRARFFILQPHDSPSDSSKYITGSVVASLKELNLKTENTKVVGCEHETHSGTYPVTGRNL